MSVINQMLRDLESRNGNVTTSRHYIDEVNIIAPKSVNLWWLVLPAMIVAILSVNVYLHFSNQKTANHAMIQTQQSVMDTIRADILSDLPDQLSEISQNPVNSVAKTPSDSIEMNRENNPAILAKASKPEISTSETLIPKTMAPSPSQIEHSVSDEPLRQPSAKIKTVIKTQTKVSASEEATATISADNSEKVVKSLVKIPVKSKQPEIDNIELIHQARLLMADDYTVAIQFLEHNLEKTTPDSDYYALMANLYQRQERFDEAIIFYQKALKITPDKGELWIGIALAYQGTGEIDNSQRAFKKAVISKNINPALKQYAAQRIFRE